MRSYQSYKSLHIALVLSPLLAYVVNSGVVAYGPVVVTFFLTLCYLTIDRDKFQIEDWLATLLFMPYVFVATFIYIQTPFQGKVFSPHLLTIIMLPFVVMSNIKLCRYSPYFNYFNFIFKIILFFVAFQLFVSIGQYFNYIFGVGLPVNEIYRDR